jgi:hypothetical protein
MNKGNPKADTVSHVINILEQADAHIETYTVEQASWLKLPVTTLKPTVKNREETEKVSSSAKLSSSCRSH